MNECNSAELDANNCASGPDPAGDTWLRTQRPQFTLASILIATAGVALTLAARSILATGTMVVLAIIVMTFAFGCWRTRRAVLFVVPAMYLPYGWLVSDLQTWPWNDYRWQWIGMWGQLPGLLAEIPVHQSPAPMFEIVTSAATLVIFFAAVMVARMSLAAARWVAAVVAVLSVLNSFVAHALYAA